MEAKGEINGLLNFLITILNIKISSEEEKLQLDKQMILIFDLIKTKYGSLTVPEIKEAFKMFIAKEFPELKVFRILDCIVVADVLNAFKEFRNESLRTYDQNKKMLLERPLEKTSEEIAEIRVEFLKTIFADLVETGFSSDSWQLFLELEAKEKIIVSVSEKKELYKAELRLYEITEKAEIRNKYGLYSTSYLKDLQNKIVGKNPVEIVANRCRSILVSKFLKNHIASFEDFKKVFE